MTVAPVVDDDAAAALFACLLWQAPNPGSVSNGGEALDEYLDSAGYRRSDIPQAEQDALLDEFTDFCRLNRADIVAFMAHTHRSMSDVAHDWVLTRNRHGTGFWDRCCCGQDDAADRLTQACRPYGGIDVVVGADGLLHIQ